jgi:hypothetical protein
MSTQIIGEQVRWQDLKVRSDIDIVLEIAKKEGWEDCEIFGYGDMITQPQESMGWKLIPADLYKYSIPIEAVGRLHQIINAGVRVQGVIIADDERRIESLPAPATPKVSLSSVKTVVSFLFKALLGFIRVVGAIALVSFFAVSLIHFWPVIILGSLAVAVIGAGSDYDPKLVILVDDGRGGTAWVSLFAWYD